MNFGLFGQGYWSSIEKSKLDLRSNSKTDINPDQYQAFELDYDYLKTYLLRAPSMSEFIDGSQFMVELPMPNGIIMNFNVWEAPILQGTTAAKFSEIKTYKGVSVDKKSTVRFDITYKGLRASIKHPDGTIYIDPIFSDDKIMYQSYYTKDQEVPASYKLGCGFVPTEEQLSTPYIASREETLPLRSYIIAISCTGEYAQIVGPDVELIMSEIATALNRLNLIFENESAVTFTLIEGNEAVIYLDQDTDPFIINPNTDGGAHPGRQVLSQNTSVLDNAFGAGSYDIGHALTRSCTDGIAGVAGGQVCTDNSGAGVSCVGNADITSFTVSVIAHEVGHQFSAGHTWSNCDPNNSEGGNQQLASGTACEPGSGTTIMSYAGVCEPGLNIKNTNDEYFHVCSLEQIHSFSREFGPQCADLIETGNRPPMIFVDYDEIFYIPKVTPFELTGSAIDMDGDDLTYNWDQVDRGPTSDLGSPIGNSPSFRSFPPSESPTRVFPALNNILGGFSRDEEVLPTTDRDLTFMFVVRDNNPLGGATVWKEIEFKARGSAGPFFVTSPNVNPPDYEVGQSVEINWDVAGTDLAPINCTAVDILLSSDGGQNFDFKLATNSPNDGSEMIRMPNALSDDCRIKIKARGNIFFDISNEDFTITEPSEPTFVYDLSETDFDVCLPQNLSVEIQSFAFQGYSEDIELSVVDGIPEGAEITIEPSVIPPDGSATIQINLDEVNTSGNYELLIEGVSGDITFNNIVRLDLTGADFSDLASVAPESGVQGLGLNPSFEWTMARNATNYTFELSTNPSFTNESTIRVPGIVENNYTPEVILEKSTLYYWRVSGSNKCSIGTPSTINTFGTLALSCKSLVADDLPKNISQSGLPVITSAISIFDEGQISAISIPKIRGLHEIISQLKATISSPSGTEVTLFENSCGNSSNFNCGFDDDSPIDISCPLSNGLTYKPKESLSAFQGESIMGDWVLTIYDQEPGGSGQFQEFNLQICSNATLEGPQLILNEVLQVPNLGKNQINGAVLQTSDANNSAADLLFTIVEIPANGFVSLNGTELGVGGNFTQFEAYSGLVRYHNTSEADTDEFKFTVIDGEGGWIDITTFNIEMNDDAMTSNEEIIEDVLSFRLVPNPANNLAQIHINSETQLDYSMAIFDVTGKRVMHLGQAKGSQILDIDLTNINSGIYFIQIESNSQILTKRLSVVK